MVVAHSIAESVLVDYGGSVRANEFRPSCSKLPVMALVFANTLADAGEKIRAELELCRVGLGKVDLIVGEAGNLKQSKDDMERQISEKSQIVDDLLILVGQKSRELEQAGGDVDDAEVIRTKAGEKLEASKEDISVALSMAKPVLATATQVLKTIDKQDLARVKTLTSPPAVVEAVLAACIILSSPPSNVAADVSWTKAKRALSSIDRFVIELLQIDKEKIPESHIAASNAYMSQTFFNPELVATISPAVATLCEWALCTVEYNRIFVNFVLPKQQALREAQKMLNDATLQKDSQQSIVRKCLPPPRMASSAAFSRPQCADDSL